MTCKNCWKMCIYQLSIDGHTWTWPTSCVFCTLSGCRSLADENRVQQSCCARMSSATRGTSHLHPKDVRDYPNLVRDYPNLVRDTPDHCPVQVRYRKIRNDRMCHLKLRLVVSRLFAHGTLWRPRTLSGAQLVYIIISYVICMRVIYVGITVRF